MLRMVDVLERCDVVHAIRADRRDRLLTQAEAETLLSMLDEGCDPSLIDDERIELRTPRMEGRAGFGLMVMGLGVVMMLAALMG